MWIIYAMLAAIFSAIGIILAKMGLKKVSANLAAGVRTIVVLIFLGLIIIFNKDYQHINNITKHDYLFTVLSGIVSALSWLFFFQALKISSVNKVAPIDKGNVVLTMIFGFLFLKDEYDIYIIIGMIIMIIGIVLMTSDKKDEQTSDDKQQKKCIDSWLVYALIAAVLASASNILAKVSVSNEQVNSNLSLTLRTIVVLIVTWLAILFKKEHKEITNINLKSWFFLGMTGLSTGAWWLFYFKALKLANASLVIPIERLSVVITIILSVIFLKEKLNRKGIIGIILITIGTSLLLVGKI